VLVDFRSRPTPRRASTAVEARDRRRVTRARSPSRRSTRSPWRSTSCTCRATRSRSALAPTRAVRPPPIGTCPAFPALRHRRRV